jgi:transcriptional regulator with XRE-family HTH domain
MNIGEIIKKLRKQKDMTQEQLAEYLNISPQAISRWEINSTLPDITLIPMLANIFDVTTDMLLGVDIDAKEKRIEAIVKEVTNHLFKRQYVEAEKMLRTALKEYPNSYKLMDKLAEVLYTNADYYDNKNGNEEEIITLGEKILAECTDDNLRYLSIERLCNAYASMGETEKSASFAKKMPNTSARKMITASFKGTKKYNHIQEQIAHDAFDVVNSIAMLMNGTYAALDDGTEPYNSDECIALYHKNIDIINILIEKGSFGDFNFYLVNAHRSLTFLYVQKGDAAAALNHFRLAAKHAVLYDAMPPVNDNFREEYTSLLFRGVKFPSITVGGSFTTMTERLLERSRELDSVLPASELEEIRNELRKHTAIN